jgi:hypothetical protein
VKAAETFTDLDLALSLTAPPSTKIFFLKAAQWRATMKTIEPVGEREVLHILQILGMIGGDAGAKTEIGGAGAMTEVEDVAKEIGMGPRDIVLEVQGGAMVEKT